MSRKFVLVALAFACLGFLPGLQGPFIHDDHSNLSLVLQPNPSWQQAIDAIFSNNSGLLRRPLSNGSFLLTYQFLGDSATAFKAINLLLHMLCGWLIYSLGRHLLEPIKGLNGSAPHIALVAAMVWLAHPLGVSTVLYVVQRMTILSALFSLSALLWLTLYLKREPTPKNNSLAIAGFYGFTLLALLSKESGALTPAYALAIVTLLGHGRLKRFISANRIALTCTIALPLMVALALVVAKFDSITAGYTWRDFDMADRLASQTVILWQYIGHIVFPYPGWMHFFWDGAPARNFASSEVQIATISWAAAALLSVRFYRTNPWPLFALLWYLGGHAIESSIIALDIAYEHRNYLPMAGPILAVIVAGSRILSRTQLPMRTAALACVAILMAATGARAFTWSSLPRLTAHEVQVAPNSLRSQYSAYSSAASRADWAAATSHLAKMRKIDPEPEWIAVNLLILHCQGNPQVLDTETILTALVQASSDERTQRGLQHLLSTSLMGACAASLPFDLRAFLVQLGEVTERQSATLVAADYYYMAASLDWNRGEYDASAALLQRSALLAPHDSRPFEQLLIVHLARGDIGSARIALERARAIWRTHEPWRLYRYQAWKAEITQAALHLADDKSRTL